MISGTVNFSGTVTTNSYPAARANSASQDCSCSHDSSSGSASAPDSNTKKTAANGDTLSISSNVNNYNPETGKTQKGGTLQYVDKKKNEQVNHNSDGMMKMTDTKTGANVMVAQDGNVYGSKSADGEYKKLGNTKDPGFSMAKATQGYISGEQAGDLQKVINGGDDMGQLKDEMSDFGENLLTRMAELGVTMNSQNGLANNWGGSMTGYSGTTTHDFGPNPDARLQLANPPNPHGA